LDSDRRPADHDTINQVANVGQRGVGQGQFTHSLNDEPFDIRGWNACCEHVIGVAAALAERVVSEAPQAHILATSREALRVEGEHVHLLYPLDCPPEDAGLTAFRFLMGIPP
jgi:hypothetical protein